LALPSYAPHRATMLSRALCASSRSSVPASFRAPLCPSAVPRTTPACDLVICRQSPASHRDRAAWTLSPMRFGGIAVTDPALRAQLSLSANTPRWSRTGRQRPLRHRTFGSLAATSAQLANQPARADAGLTMTVTDGRLVSWDTRARSVCSAANSSLRPTSGASRRPCGRPPVCLFSSRHRAPAPRWSSGP